MDNKKNKKTDRPLGYLELSNIDCGHIFLYDENGEISEKIKVNKVRILMKEPIYPYPASYWVNKVKKS